jgi:hypothetical protein
VVCEENILKTIKELKKEIDAVISQRGNMVVYFGSLDPSGKTIWEKGDLDSKTAEKIKNDYIKGVNEFFSAENRQICSLKGEDVRKDAIYMYDFDEYPEGFDEIKALVKSPAISNFSFKEKSAASIVSMIFQIGTAEKNIIFYKKVYPVSVMKRDQMLLRFSKSETRLVLLEDDLLRIGRGFNFFVLNDTFYISDTQVLEKFFKFEKIVESACSKAISVIEEQALVEDTSKMLAQKLSIKRRLIALQDSKALKLPMDNIKKFIEKKKFYSFKFSEKGRFLLDSDRSIRYFIKLMNDDFLTSELTQTEYDTLAKNVLVASEDDS